MDASNLAASAGVGGGATAILLILYRIFVATNGHRVISDCCGRRGEIGFVVREMPLTPQEEKKSPPLSVDAKGARPETVSVVVP